MNLRALRRPPAFGRPRAFPAPQPEEPRCALPLCRMPNPLVKETVSMLIVYANRDRGQYAKRPA